MRALEHVEQRRNRGSSDGGRCGQCCPLGHDAPDATAGFHAAWITQRVLSVALDGVVPVIDIHVTTGTNFDIGRNETQVGGEDDVADLLLFEVVVFFDPLVHLDVVRGLVASLHETALDLPRPEVEVDKLLSTDTRISRDAACAGMLLWIRRIQGMESISKDGMTGHMMTPVIKGDTPWIGAWVAAEDAEFLCVSTQTEPAGVVQTNRAVGRFYLAV